MQEQIQRSNSVSGMQTICVSKRQTVKDLLRKMNLESKFFAVIVNGQKVDLETTLDQHDEVLILPKIAGG